MAVVGRDLRHEFVNAAYGEYFGLSRQEITGKTLGDLLGDTPFAEIRPDIEAALSGREIACESLLDFHPTGACRVRISLHPRVGGDGDIVGLFTSLVDTTEQQNIQKALDERLRFEKLLAGTSGRFLNLVPADMGEALHKALSATGEFFRADRCFLFLMGDNDGRHHVSRVWLNELTAPDTDVVGNPLPTGRRAVPTSFS